MTRSTPEWVSKSDDAAIPPNVKLRIWEREKGVCYLSGRKIRPGEPFDYEHVVALCNGGEHRETNIRLALRDKHKAKTAQDRAELAEWRHTKKHSLGIKPKGRGFQKAPPGFKFSWATGRMERV